PRAVGLPRARGPTGSALRSSLQYTFIEWASLVAPFTLRAISASIKVITCQLTVINVIVVQLGYGRFLSERIRREERLEWIRKWWTPPPLPWPISVRERLWRSADSGCAGSPMP